MRSTPSPRRSAWMTENNPVTYPVRYRAGQAPGRQPEATSAAYGSAPPATHRGTSTLSPLHRCDR
jgi:hypothetical protein